MPISAISDSSVESFNDAPPGLLVLVGVVANDFHNGRSRKGLKRFGIPPDGRSVNAHLKDASGCESTQKYRCSSIGARVLNVHSAAPKKDGESKEEFAKRFIEKLSQL